MRFQLRHTTRYEYSSSASLSHNEARILPRNLPWQHCANAQVEISPTPMRMRERTDFFGNRVVYFSLEALHDELQVSVTSEIETRPRPTQDFFSAIAIAWMRGSMCWIRLSCISMTAWRATPWTASCPVATCWMRCWI